MSNFGDARIEDRLKERLKPVSFDHCYRTAEAAADLAGAHGVDEKRAWLAGLVHDIARDMTASRLLEKARAIGMQIRAVEAAKPYLLHAAVGAEMLSADLDINDPAIISAVKKHTFGDTKMNKLDKIVYLADIVEPARQFEGLDEIKDLSRIDIDRAFAKAYQAQMIFIVKKGGYLHPKTLDVWNLIADEVRVANE